jgi:uncharacterized membrane protein
MSDARSTTVEALPGLPGGSDTMNALAMNDLGAVVGHASPGTGQDAVLWYQGKITELGPVPGSTYSTAYDVNNRFQVVGLANVNGIARGFVWQKGSLA